MSGPTRAAEQSRSLGARAAWAQAHSHALVDPGGPLNTKEVVTALVVQTFADSQTGYAIVEAGSHDAAVEVFAAHPHLALVAGSSIEVLEWPPVSGQAA